jgi:hypothetical protein
MNIELPVKVGDVLWLPQHCAWQKTQPCSVCKGHKSVWVRNVEGEEWEVRCEACGKGYNDPQGCETDYVYEPHAARFVVGEITRVEFQKDGTVEIALRSITQQYATFDRLYANEADALKKSEEEMAHAVRQNMANNLSRKKAQLPEHAWSVRYHGDQIREAEQRIEWHRTRLLSKKKVGTKKTQGAAVACRSID